MLSGHGGQVSGATMAEFEVSNAVTLFSQENTAINNLWQVYVVATFAAAGYGLSSKDLSWQAAAAVTCGFLVFTAGNLSLILQAIRINRSLKADLLNAYPAANATNPARPYEESIRCLANTANRASFSIAAHLIIDVCVVIALWSHVAKLPI